MERVKIMFWISKMIKLKTPVATGVFEQAQINALGTLFN